MIEIRPCPFCGSKAKLEHGYLGAKQTSYVKCQNFECGVKGKDYTISVSYTSDECAVEMWNRRAYDERP